MRQRWLTWALYSVAMGLEACWLLALLDLASEQTTGGIVSPAGLLALLPLSFLLHRFTERWRRLTLLDRVLTWLSGAIALLLAIKLLLYSGMAWADTTWLLSLPRAFGDIFNTFGAPLLVLPATALLWWLGRRLARQTTGFKALLGEFQFGLFMLVITLVSARLFELELSGQVPLVLGFFGLSLAGLSVSHGMEGASWLSGIYRTPWSGLLLAAIGIILVAGLIIGLIFTPDLLQIIWSAIKTVLEFIWAGILKVLEFLASLMPDTGEVDLPIPEAPPPAASDDNGFSLRMPEWARTALTSGWLIIMSGLILLALWRISTEILRHLRLMMGGRSGTEYESLAGSFRDDMRGLFRRMFGWLKLFKRIRWRRDAAPAGQAVTSVRQTYRHFLRWAAAGGYPRELAQTPCEYRDMIGGLLPELSQDIDAITAQYVSTRYGEASPAPPELQLMNHSWQRLRQVKLKKMKGQNNL
ncbi:DUF4129 domain-containing protein [Chloroflexota bacterium]